MSDGKKADHGTKPKYKFIPAADLQFDLENPRLGGGGKNKTQPKLQEILEGPPHLALELVQSLVENGFIPYEPLIVKVAGEKYVVIEGNRRLAAVRHILANPEKYDEGVRSALKEIPVLVFPSDTPEKDVKVYLAVHHLFGFRQWPPQSKALFLDSEIRGRADVARLVGEYGIEKQEILRYLLPRRVIRAAEMTLTSFEDKDFWLLGEALNRSGIKEYIELGLDTATLKISGVNKGRFKYLLEFLYGNGNGKGTEAYSAKGLARISDTRQLSTLSKVLASERAREELEKGSTLEEAALYVDATGETILKLLNQIESLLRRFYRLRPTKEQKKHLRNIVGRVLRDHR